MQKRKSVIIVAFVLLFYAAALAEPQQKDSIHESWEGVLDYGTAKLRVELNISKASNGQLKATLTSLDQNNTELAIDSISYSGPTLRFEISRIGASFEGVKSRDGLEIAGQWDQGGARPLIFKRKGVSPGQPPPSTVKRGRVMFAPCNFATATKDALCGKYEVFEDRAARAGRKIALNIVLLPALSENPARDPIFYFEGGPGGGATQKVKSSGDLIVKRLRADRDVVFIDQRGTGESNPLPCNFYGDKTEMSRYFTDAMTIEKVRECRDELKGRADLSLYSTYAAIDDFDEVRDALGYGSINIYGGSYGSTACLVYLRQHGDHVRTAIIEGVAPTTYKLPLPFARGVEQALARLFTDCAADSDCGKTFPALRDEFNSVLARLDKGPVTFEAVNPLTRKPEQITMSRNAFMDHVRLMLYNPSTARLLPLMIHQMAAGNFSFFATISFQVFKGTDDIISRGLQLSVVCTENAQSITEDEIKRATAGTYYGDHRVRTYIAACKEWPKSKLPAGFNQPVRSNVPVLIISGAIDPVTPPELATEAVKHLSNSLHVIVHNTGHYFLSECLDRLRVEFVSNGSTKGLNPACSDDIKRPPFMLKLQ